MKGVISCGHPLTAKAAHEMLREGGNAFDAVTAACFMAPVAEPMLTTLAGGGIGMLRFSDGDTTCVDFLTDFPKKALDPPTEPVQAMAEFVGGSQEFFLGYGSIAVPGTLHGLLHVHKKYGSLELKKIIAPAAEHAQKGVVLNGPQAYICGVLKPFCFYTKEMRELFAPKGRMISEGEVFRNPKTADFLQMLGEDTEGAMSFYYDCIGDTLEGKKSTLSLSDMRAYRVKEREPISTTYRGYGVQLPPPPSAGGMLISYALKLLERSDVGSLKHNCADHIDLLIKTMKKSNSIRTKEFFKGLFLEEDFWKKFLKNPIGSTTHVSVIDEEGNAAGISSSNGETSGIVINNTGIILNNFAAEPDLMQYRELYRPGERITSMMSPTILSKGGELAAVLGTGGSNRIRSAILQVVSNLVDFKMSPKEAVLSSRAHIEDEEVQLEPGFEASDVEQLKSKYPLTVWSRKDYYFGGVHTVTPSTAFGDPRRSGAVIID
jgi:gamma-glutamyltranspeptidase/glutathione hydrolase